MSETAKTAGSADFSITIEKLPKNRLRAKIDVTKERREKAEKSAFQKLAGDVNVKGFRPGKAPEDVLRERINPDAILEQTIRELVPDMLKATYDQQQIDPIIVPKIDIVTPDPLVVTITFTETPDVKVKASGLKIDKKDHKVEAKDVDRVLKELLKEHSVETSVDRAAKEGDVVISDFSGVDHESKPIPGTDLKAYPVKIGSKTLIPGFEEGVIGMKKGETKELKLTFPEKYHAEHLQGKPVTFTVTATDVKEVKTPELTQEFLKANLGTDKTPDDLRKDIETSLISQEERVERDRREKAFFDAVEKATTIDIAEELLESEMQNLIRDLQHQMEHQKLTLDEWLKQIGKTWDDVQKDIKENAKKRLTVRFGVQNLIKQKEIVITDEEVQQKIDEEMNFIPREEQEEMKNHYAKGQPGFQQLKWELEIKKLLDMYL